MERDAQHWLYQHTAREWIQAALGELRRATDAFAQNNPRAGHAGARRAAGMALNAALIHEPDERWGRSYMEHLTALSGTSGLPAPLLDAARLLLEAPPPGGTLVVLRSHAADDRLLEAARTVMAHAYAVVSRHESGEATEPAPTAEETPS